MSFCGFNRVENHSQSGRKEIHKKYTERLTGGATDLFGISRNAVDPSQW
jgi:hypothetical protein